MKLHIALISFTLIASAACKTLRDFGVMLAPYSFAYPDINDWQAEEVGGAIDWDTPETAREGILYAWKCGAPRDPSKPPGSPENPKFNPEACHQLKAKLRVYFRSCADDKDFPYEFGSAPACVDHENTGVTVWEGEGSPRRKPSLIFETWANACGWLGGRCGADWPGSRLLVLGSAKKFREEQPKDWRGFQREGFGTIKIYVA